MQTVVSGFWRIRQDHEPKCTAWKIGEKFSSSFIEELFDRFFPVFCRQSFLVTNGKQSAPQAVKLMLGEVILE